MRQSGSRGEVGGSGRRRQEHRVEEQHPFAPIGVALEILARPAEGDLRMLPVLDQLTGDEHALACLDGVHDPSDHAAAGQPATVRRSKRAPLKLPFSRTRPELTRYTTVAITS